MHFDWKVVVLALAVGIALLVWMLRKRGPHSG